MTFKGFKQVTADYFDSLKPSEKKGYLWFVREGVSRNTSEGDVYFGSRHYGQTGVKVFRTLASASAYAKKTTSTCPGQIISVAYSDSVEAYQIGTDRNLIKFLTVEEAEERFVTKDMLYSETPSNLGVFIIDGNDIK